MIIPLTTTHFNEAMFVKIAKEALDKNIASGSSNGSSFLVLLSKALLSTSEMNESSIIKEAGSLLRHLSYGFMAALPQNMVNRLLSETCLNINYCETVKRGIDFIVISGNLLQWRDAIINCSRPNHELLELMNEFLVFFDKYGFQHLFAEYRRKKQGTIYYLEKKE